MIGPTERSERPERSERSERSEPPERRALRPDAAGIAAAAAALRRGGLMGLPTETVYGLGADARDEDAIRRVFEVKGRPADNPLIVHLADAADLETVVAEATPLARHLAARFWPGPLTLVLDAAPDLPRVTTGGLPTVAVRVPDHPVAVAVLRAAGVPVAAPSANRSGRPSPTTAAHVLDDLGDDVDVVLDGGPCPVGVESTVVDARGLVPVVLREGSIPREDLAAAGLPSSSSSSSSPRSAPSGTPSDAAPAPPVASDLRASPGTRYRHYAPRCEVRLVAPGDLRDEVQRRLAAGDRVGVVVADDAGGAEDGASLPAGALVVARYRDAAELAQRLYTALRDAEDAEVDVLVVASVPETGVGRAVMDRLRRAAAP